jgi:hypothetical protein
MSDPITDATEFARSVFEIIDDPDFAFHRLLTLAALLDEIAKALTDIESVDAIVRIKNLTHSIRRRAIV